MRILSAHQPAYLPWLGLFHKIASADDFVVLDSVQFERNSYINRNRIKGLNGGVWLTVPVNLDGHTNSTVRDIRISHQARWRKKHWKTILQYYSKAPYFDRYASIFEELYKKDWKWICDINKYCLEYLIKEIGIKTRIHYQSDLPVSGKGQDLILELCRYFGSDVFVFGALGTDYVNRGSFAGAGVKAVFQSYKHPRYPQMHGDFVSHLSIIDLLFNCGDKSLDILQSGNVGNLQRERI